MRIRDTGMQGYRDVEIKDTEKDTGMQEVKDARIKDAESTGTGMGAGISAMTGTWDKGQWVQAMLMMKSRETVWEGQTEMP